MHPVKIERGNQGDFRRVTVVSTRIVLLASTSSSSSSCLLRPWIPLPLQVNYDPQLLMGKAHSATSSRGSATVILAMLDKNGTLKIASVGDCALRVIRQGKVIFCTSPQEHHFDCPYQLSSETLTQTSLDATVSSIQLTAGDTIVMGSDGLFDNVFDHEIASIISASDNVTNAAKALADLAREHSMDRNFDSPFALEARNMGFDVPLWKKILGRKLTGGKPDDITVIVAQATSS